MRDEVEWSWVTEERLCDLEEQAARGIDGAVARLKRELPGWWFSCGKCNLSGHASVGPDRDGPDASLLSDPEFDGGFDADIEGGEPADALNVAIDLAIQARKNRGIIYTTPLTHAWESTTFRVSTRRHQP